MKVAVTGGTGFVGRYVLDALTRRRSLDVTAISRNPKGDQRLPSTVRQIYLDIADPPLNSFEKLGRPDLLIHLAWDGLPNYKSLHHFETELPRQYVFLRSLLEAGLSSLFVTGTCYEYGMRCGELHESMRVDPANPYAYAKNALRQQLEFLRLKVNFKFTWSRLFYMYGNGQAESSVYAQLARAVMRGDPSFAMSRGDQIRDYLSVEEVARYIIRLAVDAPASGIVNVCSGVPVSIRSLVEKIIVQNNWEIELELGRYPYPDHEPFAFWGCSGKLQRIVSNGALERA